MSKMLLILYFVILTIEGCKVVEYWPHQPVVKGYRLHFNIFYNLGQKVLINGHEYLDIYGLSW